MADNTQTFLVEIGMEELPPKALKTLQDAFAASVAAQLAELDLSYTTLHPFSSLLSSTGSRARQA